MSANQVPADITAAIRKCWPDGVIEEFAADESYFHEIHARLERDLRKIPGASLLWQTEGADADSAWDDDGEDEPPPDRDWQSYHVFFLAPAGKEFQFEDETEGLVDLDESGEEEGTAKTYPGEGWIGHAVGICLAAPMAIINPCRYAHSEDGSTMIPEVESFIFSDETGERVDTGPHFQEVLGAEAFAKLENLGRKIAAVLTRHGVRLLDESVSDLPVPALTASEEVFLEKPLRVRDAFFFRGV